MTAAPVQHLPDLTVTHDGLIWMLWKQGKDTYEIATRLGLKEFQVANRLPHIRETMR